MTETAIKMKANTWASDKRRLGLGTVHAVPGEVSAKDAETLVKAGKAGWVDGSDPGGAVALSEIVEAITKLDKDNTSHFTKSGAPQVKAIEELLGGRQISAGERDAAVAAMTKGG